MAEQLPSIPPKCTKARRSQLSENYSSGNEMLKGKSHAHEAILLLIDHLSRCKIVLKKYVFNSKISYNQNQNQNTENNQQTAEEKQNITRCQNGKLDESKYL